MNEDAAVAIEMIARSLDGFGVHIDMYEVAPEVLRLIEDEGADPTEVQNMIVDQILIERGVKRPWWDEGSDFESLPDMIGDINGGGCRQNQKYRPEMFILTGILELDADTIQVSGSDEKILADAAKYRALGTARDRAIAGAARKLVRERRARGEVRP